MTGTGKRLNWPRSTPSVKRNGMVSRRFERPGSKKIAPWQDLRDRHILLSVLSNLIQLTTSACCDKSLSSNKFIDLKRALSSPCSDVKVLSAIGDAYEFSNIKDETISDSDVEEDEDTVDDDVVDEDEY